MAIDTTAPALALSLITKYGITCVYTFNVEGVYNPATSTVTNTTTSQTLKALVEDYAIGLRMIQSYGQNLANGQSIIEGDKKITLPGSGLNATPKAGDTISVGKTSPMAYNILGVTTLYAGENPALYACHARKA